MKSLFQGTAVAIVTPFIEGGVDYIAFEKLIEREIVQGVKAIVVLGTTGESATVSEKERERLIKIAKKKISGRVKLIVGTGSNNFEKAYLFTLMAKRLGVDGVLVVTPYYNKTTQRGVKEYYQRLGKIGIPMIVYNVPSRTGLMIELSTIKDLIYSCDMIYGIKESTSDVSRIISLAKICSGRIALYSGEDGLNYIFYCLGANGCISVSANVCPQKVQNVYEYMQKGDYRAALREQCKLDAINEAMFLETNPIPVKYALSKLGLIKNELRLPLVSISPKNAKKVDKILKNKN